MHSVERKNRLVRQAEAGYTLTELLVVMVVLGLIAAAITPQVLGRLDKSKVRAPSCSLIRSEHRLIFIRLMSVITRQRIRALALSYANLVNLQHGTGPMSARPAT